MSLIDIATSHFSNRTKRSIEIPELGVTLYAKNVSLADKANWLKRADNDTTSFMVYAIIYGLTDEKGEKVFDVGDKTKLLNSVDPEIVAKLFNFVNETAATTPEEAEKNS